MCIPAPSDPARPSQSFPAFLGCLDIPPRDGSINVRITGPLPCGCLPSRAAKKSGQRRLTISASAGTVKHTRCGQIIARYDGTFVSEPMPEPPPRVVTTPPTTKARPTIPPVHTGDESHDTGRDFQSGCSLP